MDVNDTIYPQQTAYCETRRRIDSLIRERSAIEAKINDESREATHLAATLIRSMRAAGATVLNSDRNEQVIVLMDDRLEIHPAHWADSVPLVLESEPTPEPIGEAIRTVWGDVAIGDGGFLSKVLTGWTPPTDAEIDAAAAQGALDDLEANEIG
jgi:hypothetical protein